MKTTLCDTCNYGLVREWECADCPDCGERHFTNKCLLGKDYPGQVIISCSKYMKTSVKVTYHDPDYEEYEKRLEQDGEKHEEVNGIIVSVDDEPIQDGG